MMAYRLWSMDPEAGEAVVQGEGIWYFVSSDNGWQPFRIDEETAVGWWLSGASVEEDRSDFKTLEEAVEAVRERFLALQDPARPGLRRGPGAPARRLPREASEAMRFYVSQRAGGFLKIFGCREAESAELKAEVTRHFQEQAEPRESKHDLDAAILSWTREVYARRFGEAKIPAVSPPWADQALSGEERRLLEAIRGFPQTVVRCLALWSEESGYGVQEISTLLRLPKEEVQEHLAWAVDRLDLPPDRLRDPALARACRALTAERPRHR